MFCHCRLIFFFSRAITNTISRRSEIRCPAWTCTKIRPSTKSTWPNCATEKQWYYSPFPERLLPVAPRYWFSWNLTFDYIDFQMCNVFYSVAFAGIRGLVRGIETQRCGWNCLRFRERRICHGGLGKRPGLRRKSKNYF